MGQFFQSSGHPVSKSPLKMELVLKDSSEVVLQILEVDDGHGWVGLWQELVIAAVQGQTDLGQATAAFGAGTERGIGKDILC